MGDLIRLVLRSRAQGLKVRLAGALFLVLIGKWTGVVGPLLISHAIDRLNHHHADANMVGGGQAVFVAFSGLVT